MPILNKGRRGISVIDQPLKLGGASWFEPQAGVSLFDDFLIDVLADDPYVTVAQSGTPLTAAAVSGAAGPPTYAGAGGWIAGKSDDVDAEIDEISIGGLGTGAGTPWLYAARAGNSVLVCEWGLVIPTALTARQYYVGLTDDPVEGTGTNGSLNITGTYTLAAIADNAAGFVFSSLATNPTIWKSAAVKATVVSSMSAANESITGVVDCYTTLRVEIDSLGNAFYYASIHPTAATGTRIQPSYVNTLSSAVTTTVGLLPIVAVAPTTTTGVEWELDYVFAGCSR